MKQTDHIRILDWLSDGTWKCSTEIDFMRDARKRISELVQKGYQIEGISCDGRCNTIHKSKNLKMRRLVIPFEGVFPNQMPRSNEFTQNQGLDTLNSATGQIGG